jgi:ATP-dependent Clp protease ATP-binding subunit ClpA
VSMFKRYSPPARRVIFFAREIALHAGSDQIDSTHILSGLLIEQSTHVNRGFQLSSHFPDETARLKGLKRFPQPKDIPLSSDGKKIVAGAAAEADRLHEYWIDTDHLMLAILSEPSCPASISLSKAGYELGHARSTVSKMSGSRETYGTPPALWWLERPISKMGKVRALLYLLFVLMLISLVAGGIHWSER